MEELAKGLKELKLEIPAIPPKSILDEGILDMDQDLEDEPGRRTYRNLSRELVQYHHKSLLNLLRTDDDLRKEQAILVSLDFEARSSRSEAIPPPYTATFECAFNSGLCHWLRSERKIFWISGKAGSGKSTFMKYVVNYFRTLDLLIEWATPRPVTIASHYFWAAGAAEQKSQTGLLRTLLYEVLRQCPSCIPILIPNRWDQRNRPTATTKNQPWSHTELMQALSKLADEENLPAAFCFFIDGADEYNGEHIELCSVLKSLAQSPHVKLCLSSRPWNVFKDYFGQDQHDMLQLHEFTQDDILKFSRDRLESHPRWITCSIENKKQREGLIQTIGARADGVFLWAFLVTKSLREGLTNGDSTQELKIRLDRLPTDLERLFKFMLEQVDPIYHDRMGRMLQIALHAKGPLKLDIYGYHDMEYDDENFSIHSPVKERQIGELLDIYDEARRRINSRTNGLLECRNDSYNVDFLHRTVSDFLKTNEMMEYIASKIRPGFDAFISIARAFVAYIKSTRFRDGVLRVPPPSQNSGRLIEQLNTTLEYASRASKEKLTDVSELLDELEHAVDDMFRLGQASFMLETSQPKHVFREEVLRSNAADYLKQKLCDIPDYLSGLEVAPISVAVAADLPSVDTIHVLLKGGEDPNRISKLMGDVEMSPWTHLCFVASPWSFSSLGQGLLNYMLGRGCQKLFLLYSANPNATPSNCNFSAFAMYLMVAFCHPGYIQKPDEFLRTLDDFLNEGANLAMDISLKSSFYGRHLPCYRWWPDQGESMSVYCAFIRGLESWKEATDKRNGRFLAEVMRRLLIHSKTPQNVIDGLRSVVLQVFGEHVGMPLLNQINRRVSQKQVKSELGKRKRTYHGNEEQG